MVSSSHHSHHSFQFTGKHRHVLRIQITVALQSIKDHVPSVLDLQIASDPWAVLVDSRIGEDRLDNMRGIVGLGQPSSCLAVDHLNFNRSQILRNFLQFGDHRCS